MENNTEVNSLSKLNGNKHVINFGVCYLDSPNNDLLKTNTNIKTHEYHFKSHNVSLSQFKNIFYSDEYGIYNINEMYKNSEFINFSKQKLEDSDSIRNLDNLTEYIVSVYENCLYVTRDNINSIILMNLNKQLLKIRSLCDICNIQVYHTFKELETIISNYSKIDDMVQLNFKFVYKNEAFKDIEIVFNFYYDIDFEIDL
jgi:hypothetical protein